MTGPVAADRDSLLFLAKIAEQTERFEDMVDYMKQVAAMPGELSVDERNMFSLSFKSIVGSLRKSWRIMTNLEQNEEAKMNMAAKDGGAAKDEKSQHLDHMKQYTAQIEKELEEICNVAVDILTDTLLPNAESSDAKVFYYKMRGDYYRYLAEFMTGDRRKEVAEASLESYQSATDVANKDLSTTHPLRLGLALNFSVFYFEIMNGQERARQLAQQAFNDAFKDLENLPEGSYHDSMLIMGLLRDNITLWTTEMEETAAAAAADRSGKQHREAAAAAVEASE